MAEIESAPAMNEGKDRPPQALPLDGLRIVVTRASHQAGPLAAAFEVAGATVEQMPLLEIRPPSDPEALTRALHAMPESSWLVLTSANALAFLLPELRRRQRLGAEGRLRHAAIGPATGEALRSSGLQPSLELASGGGAELAGELIPHLQEGEPVLLPQASDARPELQSGLRKAGIAVRCVEAYCKILPEDAADRALQLFSNRPLGWVTFTSPRIVRHFVQVLPPGAWPQRRSELRALSIGKTTSAELREHGVEPTAEAASSSVDGLVEALVQAVGRSSSSSA